MPFFIDESGDTGHGRGSLPFFRLAAVWVPSLDVAEQFRAAVRQLRTDQPVLQLEDGFEFKFHKTHGSPARRAAFFGVALNYPFRFAVSAIDKTKGHWTNSPAKEQHWVTTTDLAVAFRSTLHEAEATHPPDRPLRESIWVDDNEDKKFLKAVEVAFQGLRSRLRPDVPMTKTPKFRGSTRDEMMHLADMVCGAAGAFIAGDPAWYDLIKARCVGLTRMP